jgi:hypothetical protein
MGSMFINETIDQSATRGHRILGCSIIVWNFVQGIFVKGEGCHIVSGTIS